MNVKAGYKNQICSYLLALFVLTPLFATGQGRGLLIPTFDKNRNGEKKYEDSLKRVGKKIEMILANQPGTIAFDTLRMQLYATMSEVYVDANRFNLDTAFTYSDKLYLYARKYKKMGLMMDAIFRKELKYNRLHEYSESLKLCFEAIDLCNQMGKDCVQRWKIEQILGNTFLYSADFINAEKYILQSLSNIKDSGGKAKTMLNLDHGYLHGTLAKIYDRWNKKDKAEKEYLVQLSFMREIKWDEAIANASEEIGDFYNNSGSPAKALPYYDEALQINLKYNNEEHLASVYNSKAEAYLNLNHYDQALEFAHKALHLAQKNKLTLLMPYTYRVIQKANEGLGNELESLKASQKFWSLKDSIDLKKRVLQLSDVRRLYDLEQAKTIREKERISEAFRISSLQKQYELTKLQGEKLAQDFRLETISRKLEKEYALAREQSLKTEAYTQKIEQEKLSKQLRVNELSAKLQLENQQKKSLLFIMGLIALLGISALLYSLVLKKKNRELLHKNFEIQEALLKGQTIERKRVANELHDNVGSLLSAVRVSLLTLNSEKLPNHDQKVFFQIQEMVSNACSEVRQISHNLLPEELEKYGLEMALKKMVERLNFSTPIEFTLNSKGLKDLTLDQKTVFNVYSICLELINNILKHSMASDATMTFRKKEKTLDLYVRDNGRGLGNYEKGQGLLSIEDRVQSMNGILEIESSEEEGTRMLISIPIKQTKV